MAKGTPAPPNTEGSEPVVDPPAGITPYYACRLCGRFEAQTMANWTAHIVKRHAGANMAAARRAARASRWAYCLLSETRDLDDERFFWLFQEVRGEAARRYVDDVLTCPYPKAPAGPGDERRFRTERPAAEYNPWEGTIRIEVDVRPWPGGWSGWR